MDEKTVLDFARTISFYQKSFTVPSNIEKIASGAFSRICLLRTITIPTTVKAMDDKVFKNRSLEYLTIVKFKDTKEEWDKRFSNVDLEDIALICKKSINRKIKIPSFMEKDHHFIASEKKDYLISNPIVREKQLIYLKKLYYLSKETISLMDISFEDAIATVKCERCEHEWSQNMDTLLDNPVCPNCG